jgi:hypothetical protein
MQYWADAATQNCVWLFQIRQKVVTNRGELEYIDRRELIERMLSQTKSQERIKEAVREYEREGYYPYELLEFDDDTWYTEAVLLHREEARRLGKSRPYAWGEEGDGWRIYGVPLKGRAVELLHSAGVNQEVIDKHIKENKNV